LDEKNGWKGKFEKVSELENKLAYFISKNMGD